MDNEKKYFAFISYKREDEKWAKWLQHKLEHYKLPSNLNGRTDLPKEIRPVFRDQSELAGGVLADEIQKALEASRYLIVICSPRAAQSQWVGKEVQSFIDMGRTDKIIPFIIGGTAHAQDPEDECFPSALLNLPPEQELLGINIDEMGRDAAAVKVVAQMFELKFDTLWQRYEREQKRKKRFAVVFAIVALGVAGWIWHQNVILKEKDWKMMENQSRFVAEKAQSIVKTDSYLARLLAVEVLPSNLENPERPYTVEAESLLREAVMYNSAILKGHSDWVTSASFSPDAKYVVSSSFDHTIIIWEVASGTAIRVLKGHKDIVNTAAFSPDGKSIVSASNDSTIRIWDFESGQQIWAMKDLKDDVKSAFYSPDGKHIVSTSGFVIRYWDVESKKLVRTIRNHSNWVNYASFSPDGKQIISASEDETAVICDAETGEILKVLVGYPFILSSRTKTFTGNPFGINTVHFSPDGRNIVTTSTRQHLGRVWDAETGATVNFLKGHTGGVLYAVYSPDGKQIATSSYDKTVKIWDAESGDLIRTLEGHTAHVNYVAFSPDGNQIVSASADHTIRIWSDRAVVPFNTRRGHTSGIDDIIEIDPMIARITGTGRFEVFLPEFDTTVFLGDDNVKIPRNKTLISSDKKRLVYTDGRTITISDASSRMPIWELKGHTGTINSAVFNPDGKRVVSASTDQTVKVWDVSSGQLVFTITGFLSSVYYASYNPDGKRIVATSNDMVSIWDAESGQHIQTIEGHTDKNYTTSFSTDGKYILSSFNDSTTVIWPFPPLQDLIDQTRERFKDRQLTPEERHQYYLE